MSSPDDLDLRLDALERTLAAFCSRVRWEVRGPRVVLVGDLQQGRIEVQPGAGERCEVRLVGLDQGKLAWVAAALIGAERAEPRREPLTVHAR